MARSLGRWTLYLDDTAVPERSLIGGKAWSIARMRGMGLPVPPAFVITTDACRAYLAQGDLPAGLRDEIGAGIAVLERESGRRFGQGPHPLLVAVRSGAAASMPGMMDTVLNLGIDAAAKAALAAESGDVAFARDTHRRFYDMYARIVLKATLADLDKDAGPEAWRTALAAAGAGAIPATATGQLEGAVRAVFESWNGRRAKRYRQHHGIPDEAGTAVTIQAMVFGNLGRDSGSGVVFSRNPLTGAPAPYGEYLAMAQGEDVVSGKHTPDGLEALNNAMPALHDALLGAAQRLEQADRDIQDIEFTIQKGELYLLQARAAKRAPAAAVRIAVDMVREGTIVPEEALRRVNAEQIRGLLAPRLANGAAARARLVAHGESACHGVGVGQVVLDADAAETAAANGRDVVLIRPTTSPEDVHGKVAARAVVTARGGATSHAAVVSRALGRPCVVGCGDEVLQGLDGRQVTVEGGAGLVFDGTLPVTVPDERDDPLLRQLEAWARAAAPLAVYRDSERPAAAALDLDGLPGGESPENLPQLLAGAKGAAGGALARDAGVAAAVACGLAFIVVPQALPALLAACAARRKGRGVDAA